MTLKRVLEGVTLIAVGAILLGNTLGYLPWSVWWNVFSLWPLLLVAAGIDIVGRGLDNTWLRAFSSLIVIGGLAYGALVMPTTGWSRLWWIPAPAGRTESFEFEEVHDPAITRGRATLEAGAGEFSLDAGTDLVRITGRSPFGRPDFSVTKSGSDARVRFEPREGSGTGDLSGSRAEVELSRSVEWDVSLKGGVAGVDADMSRLEISKLDVEAGVSATRIRLGDPVGSRVPVRLQGGVSSIELRIPEGAAASVRLKRGLAGIDLPSGFEKTSDEGDTEVWTTADYRGATRSYDVRLETGLAGIDVEWY